MLVGLNEVIDGEVVFALKGTGAASDDLLELDDRADDAQQNDVTDITRINASGEFLRGCENGGDGFLVVLKGTEMLFSDVAILGGDPHTVVWIGADFILVDQVADGQGMILGGAKYQSLLVLINQIHEELHPIAFSLFDLDDAIEVGFGIDAIALNLSFHDIIVRAIKVFIQGGFNLLDFEGSQKSIVDTVFERVGVDGFTKVGIGVGVVCPFGGGGQPQLYCW